MTLVAERPEVIDRELPVLAPVVDVSITEENPFAESDAILASWASADRDAGWDAGSQKILHDWTEQERAIQEEGEIVKSMRNVGILSEQQLVEIDPLAYIRTDFEATDYTATAEPTKVRGKLASWLGHGTKTSYDILNTEVWNHFDLRAETHKIHQDNENMYWFDVEQTLQTKVALDPAIEEEPARLNAALVEARAEAGPFTQMSELEKWGYQSKPDAQDTPKPGTKRFAFYSAISSAFEKLGNIKPIARLQVAVGQAQAGFGEAVRNVDGHPTKRQFALLGLGAAVMSGIVSAGYMGMSELVPSESDLYNAAARALHLE